MLILLLQTPFSRTLPSARLTTSSGLAPTPIGSQSHLRISYRFSAFEHNCISPSLRERVSCSYECEAPPAVPHAQLATSSSLSPTCSIASVRDFDPSAMRNAALMA